jgi:hypothetical protein
MTTMAKQAGSLLHRALLECPIKKSSIEFTFSDGDTVEDLQRAVQEHWGLPERGGGAFDWGVFFQSGAWALMCETADGSFIRLTGRQKLPSRPPVAAGPAVDNDIEQHIKRFAGWRGLRGGETPPSGVAVRGDDFREHIPVRIAIKKPRREAEYEVRFVALIALRGG